MKTFPMFLQMEGRRVVIVGGGEQAAQKCRLILKTEAAITIHADALDPELADLHSKGRVAWQSGPITASCFADTSLVFIADTALLPCYATMPGARQQYYFPIQTSGAVKCSKNSKGTTRQGY